MIISLAHNKGGVGKTTTALNLIPVLKPDVIIDQDAHSGLEVLNQLREQPFNVITCDNKKELINILKTSEQGKMILIDCGGFDSDLNRIAIAASDLIIVPANDDVTELIGLKSFDKVLADLSKNFKKELTGHVLYTRAHPSRKNFDYIDEYLSKSNYLKRLNSIISHRKTFEIAKRDGLGVVEHKKTKYGDSAKEIKVLAKEISEFLKDLY